jgi:hypothetical protein
MLLAEATPSTEPLCGREWPMWGGEIRAVDVSSGSIAGPHDPPLTG